MTLVRPVVFIQVVSITDMMLMRLLVHDILLLVLPVALLLGLLRVCAEGQLTSGVENLMKARLLITICVGILCMFNPTEP